MTAEAVWCLTSWQLTVELVLWISVPHVLRHGAGQGVVLVVGLLGRLLGDACRDSVGELAVEVCPQVAKLVVSVVADPELGTGVGPELAQLGGGATHTRSSVQQVELFCTLVVVQTFCSSLCPQAFLLEYGQV